MKILSIAWKDNLLRFSDRSELLFFLVLPVIFTLVLSGSSPAPSTPSIPVLVVNEDGSLLSQELVSALSISSSIQPQVVTRAEAEKKYGERNAPAWLTIPAGFGQALISAQTGQLDLRRLPNNTDADAAERAISAALSRVDRLVTVANTSVREAERLQPFASEDQRQAYFTQSLAAARSAFNSAPNRVSATLPEAASTRSTYDPATQASTGQLITWVLVPLLGTSALFAYERQRKTLPRLLTTPTTKSEFLLGTITGQLSGALVQMAILIAFGALVLHVQWGRSPAGLAVMAVTFGLASVALGTMLGSFIKTEKQASNLSILLGMGLALLGGCWWPAELFPPAMQSASLALPTTWAMKGFNDLALRGLGLAQILPSAAALLGFAAVFFLVGMKRLRYE